MALTMASYLYKKVKKSEECVPMNVGQLEIIKPLIAKGPDSRKKQIVTMTATAERRLSLVKIHYNSMARDGSEGDLHAVCVVEYGEAESWLAEWSRLAYLFRSRIDVLAQAAQSGRCKKIGRAQAYEAFSSLVQYGKNYHGMKEVILDSDGFEATSLIELQTAGDDGDFEANPYWVDNIAHISGFVLNGSDAVDSRKQVYISHGWKSLQILRTLSAHKTYRNHVKMHPGPKQTMVGDVYVFDGEEMIALIGGVKFQAIPRSLLNRVLPPVHGVSAQSKEETTLPTKDVASRARTERSKPTQPPSSSEVANKHTASKAEPQAESRSVATEFMSIISDELGVERSELADEAVSVDVGIDSLMSLTITGRLREELSLDVPASLFVDNATIGEAKSAILDLAGSQSIESTSISSAVSADAMSSGRLSPDTSLASEAPIQSAHSIIEKVLGIIRDELGVEHSVILETGSFADMGVDSLMSLTITGRVREELDLDVSSSFFVDYPDVNAAKSAISAMVGTASGGEPTPISHTESATPFEDDKKQGPLDPDGEGLSESIENIRPHEGKLPPATSILLSGNPKAASKILFLFPDGSGSATSYSSLPSVAPDICVYALNCPFMKSPADFTIGIDGVCTQYLVEVRRRQPRGPYYLGGWSAGGVLAYQASHKLLELGEHVERLFLIDSPCPIDLKPLPSSLLQFIDSVGLLGTQNSAPAWLIPHFEASIKNLAAYAPIPMNPLQAPKTLIVWARDGLNKNMKDRGFPRSSDEAASVKFLLDDRFDLGPKGWDELLGDENILTMPIQGNHFTMIRKPEVGALRRCLRWELTDDAGAGGTDGGSITAGT